MENLTMDLNAKKQKIIQMSISITATMTAKP